MARAVAYLIKIATEDEAGPGVILADGPEPAHRTNGKDRRSGHGNAGRAPGQKGAALK